jgi:hypothetical protein
MNDRRGIAERLRGLFGRHQGGDLGLVAERLGVDEVALRISVDELAPYPTLEVITAVVEGYGVDPSWLLTGDYDSRTHMRVLGDRRQPEGDSLRQLIQELNRPAPLAFPRDEERERRVGS